MPGVNFLPKKWGQFPGQTHVPLSEGAATVRGGLRASKRLAHARGSLDAFAPGQVCPAALPRLNVA